MTNTGCRHLVVISDLHAGSTVSLCPPDYPLAQGGKWRLSPAQKVVWEQWKLFWNKFVPWATGGEKYALLVNGDCCEGMHHGTTELISNTETDQIGIAKTLLRGRVERAHCSFITNGTPAHVGASAWREQAVARQLQEAGLNVKCNYVWELCVGDHVIHAAHHIGGTSSPASMFTALAKEINAAALDTARWGGTMPDMIVRSHIHQYKRCEMPVADGREIVAISTPAWQLKTEFAWKNFRFDRPQIGGVVISSTPYGLDIRRQTWVPPTSGPIETSPTPRPNGTTSSTRSKKRKAQV